MSDPLAPERKTVRLKKQNLFGSGYAGLGVEERPLPHPRILEAIMPATFVLVHGAWLGGWCWKKVTPLLRAAGHQVFAPTLTGLGERSHLFSPEVGLDTHV